MSVIDDYLASVPPAKKAELERIRKIVNQTVPSAVEVITYGMPGFKYKNKYLVAFAPFKDHLSIFPGSHAIEATKVKLTKYKLSKGTIQFTLDTTLPDQLIIDLVTVRKNDIDTIK